MKVKTILFALTLVATLYGHTFLSSESAVYISQNDINDAAKHGKNGYVLKQPGTYILSADIDWSSLSPDSFALTIASDAITLNGDGHCIKQLDTSIKHAFGIQVLPGCKNSAIKNIKLDSLSGGGIWFRGGNDHLTVQDIKTTNCGYLGLTLLDAASLPKCAPGRFSQAILLDGGYGNPITDAQIIDCTFVETGILRKGECPIYETASGALLAYKVSNLIVKGCTVDGCVGRDKSWGLALLSMQNARVADVFITDIISSQNAEAIFTSDIDGEILDVTKASILSNIPSSRFEYLLDNHPSVKELVADDDGYVIEACHLKGIVPKHRENEPILYDEHKWREFRTLYRMVCHNSHVKSKTSGIYAKWVELFCEKILGVKVRVEGGFANLYLHGDTPLPAHRDQYKKWVFGLSFGETRTLDFIPDNPNKKVLSYPMESGDVFLFAPDVNNRYQHRMLAEPQRTGRRINITYFLEILPGQDSKKLLHPPEFKAQSIPTFEEAEIAYNQTAKPKAEKKVVFQDEKGNFYEKVNGGVNAFKAHWERLNTTTYQMLCIVATTIFLKKMPSIMLVRAPFLSLYNTKDF